MSQVYALDDFPRRPHDDQRVDGNASVTVIFGPEIHELESQCRLDRIHAIINFLDNNPMNKIITSAKVRRMTQENWEALAEKMGEPPFSRTTQWQVVLLLREREIEAD